jgi:mono/diheme cytochrome c family protein
LKKLIVGLSALIVVVAISACRGEGDADTNRFPIEVTDSRIEAGELIYADNCASCHGPVNGPTVLDSAPVHGDAGHTWHHPDRLLFQWVLDRPPLAVTMPAFRDKLTEEEVIDALAFIKSHWLPEIQDRQAEGSAQYEDQIIEFGVE